MDTTSRLEARMATQQLRRPPCEPAHIMASFAEGGKLDARVDERPPAPLVMPIELTVEATDADGEVADWFNDFWWTKRLARWRDQRITVHVASTPQALLHPVVLHHLEMIRRVAPRWRLVGHTFRSDMVESDVAEQVAKSAYAEVRFRDEARPGIAEPSGRMSQPVALDILFGEIRRAQQRMRTTRPILVRMPGRNVHVAERITHDKRTGPRQEQQRPSATSTAP